MMNFIDTHCHLDSEDYQHDLEDVLSRSVESGVNQMVTIGASLERSRVAVNLAQRYNSLFAVVGIHPDEVSPNSLDGDIDELRLLARSPRVVAIGECGLDYFRPPVDKDAQEALFRAQIRLAHELKLPLVIHAREALDDVYRVLSSEPHGKAVLHCYTGTLDYAKRFVQELGCHISFTGITTFGERKIGEMADILKWIPADCYFLETDAPYLAPAPKRGRRNEPSYVPFIAEHVAVYRNVSVEQVAEETTRNAKYFFDLY